VIESGGRARAALVASLVVALAIAACGEDQPTCFAAEYAACSCSVAASGYQQCLASEDGYGPCVCNGRTPGVDAGAGTGAPRDGGDGAAEVGASE
jgi:hypothetical protein